MADKCGMRNDTSFDFRDAVIVLSLQSSVGAASSREKK